MIIAQMVIFLFVIIIANIIFYELLDTRSISSRRYRRSSVVFLYLEIVLGLAHSFTALLGIVPFWLTILVAVYILWRAIFIPRLTNVMAENSILFIIAALGLPTSIPQPMKMWIVAYSKWRLK